MKRRPKREDGLSPVRSVDTAMAHIRLDAESGEVVDPVEEGPLPPDVEMVDEEAPDGVIEEEVPVPLDPRIGGLPFIRNSVPPLQRG